MTTSADIRRTTAGGVAGAATMGAAIVPAVAACSAPQGVCMAACAAMAGLTGVAEVPLSPHQQPLSQAESLQPQLVLSQLVLQPLESSPSHRSSLGRLWWLRAHMSWRSCGVNQSCLAATGSLSGCNMPQSLTCADAMY